MADESQKMNQDDCEDENRVITLKEAIEAMDEEDEELDTLAGLAGPSPSQTCTYPEGYLKRQALYSCLTCIPEAKQDPEKGAGVCLACSFVCHQGHELISLYTKRNFRCDCGNGKFSGEGAAKCTFQNDKSDSNELNGYNQNFSGMYCVCHRPYPDPEDPVPDEMIQCIICEDWYHSRHLGTDVSSDNFIEMTCEACVTKHPFLLHYEEFCLNKTVQSEDDPKVDQQDEAAAGPSESYCKKPKKVGKASAKFWIEESWRKSLCTCDDCLKMYENEDVAFLLDSDDPVATYAEKGKTRFNEMVDSQEAELFKNMDRSQLGNFAAGYADYVEQLGEFFRKFADDGKVVQVADVQEFIAKMNARRREGVAVQRFCH